MNLETMMQGLPEAIKIVLRDIHARGNTLDAREWLRLLSFLLAWGGAYKAQIMSILYELAMLGRLNIAALMEALTLVEAGEGASVVAAGTAEATGAGATGVAAGGAGLAGAALAVAVAIGILIVAATAYIAYDLESRVTIKHPPMGQPCAVATGPAGAIQALSRSAVGSRSSLNKALAAAQADAEARITCTPGACGTGRTCAPVAIIITANPKYRVFWTTTDATYTLGCACV